VALICRAQDIVTDFLFGSSGISGEGFENRGRGSPKSADYRESGSFVLGVLPADTG
jgi:hypothetical protein